MGGGAMSFGGQRQRQQPRPKPIGTHAPGSVVMLEGLGGAPEHNGEAATVQRWDPSSGRYHVALQSTRRELAVKPANVRAVVTNARVTGVASKPELVGRAGTIADVQDGERYVIQFSPTETF